MSENTEDLEARIAAYIDGQLPPAEAARLEVFLANTDPRLAEQIIGMLNDRHRLRSLPRPAAPIDLAGRVMEQVERATLLNDTHAPDHHAPHRWWQSKAAIAAMFFLMIGGFSYFVAVAVISGGSGGGTPRQVANSDKAAKAPAIPEPVTSLPTAAPTESERVEDRKLAKAGPVDGDRAVESINTPTAPALKTPSPPASVVGGMGGGGTHGPVAMKTSDPTLRVAGEKDIEKAEKVEQVVSDQLVRNREVVQNGQVVASKLGYANVESPLRALEHIAANSSPSAPDPVVVTFVARDERDFTRLRLALEDILNQDPAAAVAQTALHNKYRFNISNINRRNSLNNTVANNGDLNLGQAQRQMADASKPSVSGITNGNATNLTNGSTDGNGYQFWDPANRGFDTTDNNALARADTSANGQTAAQGNAVQPNAAPTGAAAKDKAASNIKGELAKESDPTPAAPTPAAQAPAQTAAQPQSNLSQQPLNNADGQRRQALQNFDAGPLYRVALRQDQLVQLASQFRVDSITCGRQSYRITPDNYDYQLARAKDLKTDEPAEFEKRGARATGKKAGDEPFAPVPAGPPSAAGSAATPEPTVGAEQKAAAATEPRELQKQLASTANTARQTDNTPSLKPAAWIECIITMEQSPAQATRPTSTDAAQTLTK